MVAFGDTMIDSLGRIRETPSVSAVSGLLSNALGIRREDHGRLSRLQNRLVLACRVDRVALRFSDFQTAQLNGKDRGWTTSGRVQERAGGTTTFDSPHIRERDYDSDVSITLALRLRDAAESPTLEDIAHAIQWPSRPLFLGRKCCLPSAPMFYGLLDAEHAFAALQQIPLRESMAQHRWDAHQLLRKIVVTLPPDEPCPQGFERVFSTERRDWPAGVHAGEQRRYRGTVDSAVFKAGETS